MALTDDSNGTGMVMPVAPMYGGGYGNGMGGFGGDWNSWIILFLIFGMFGGWGNGFGGGFGGGYGNMQLGFDFPWLLNGQQGINANTNSGFQNALLNDNITSVRDGINALSTQLCGCCGDMQVGMANGFNSVNQNISNGLAGVNLGIANSTAAIQNSLCNGFNGVNNSVFGAQAAITQQMNANEIANLNRSFAEQSANAQGFNGVNAGVADLRYTVAKEACADRAAVGDALQNVTMQNMGNTNQIVNAINGGIQSIKDQLCQYRDDQKNETIANLRQELMYSRGQASQVEQTAQILANNNAQTALFQQGLNNEVDQLYNRLKNCPVGTVPVFGNQPIFTCPTNVNGGNGCGCCNSF
jgi:hypothetical protein